MFAAVAVFGLCTLTFGLSKIVWLSGWPCSSAAGRT
jgi:hypothetical protein